MIRILKQPLRRRYVRISIGCLIFFVLVAVALASIYTAIIFIIEKAPWAWCMYKKHRADLTPLAALCGGAILAFAALGQVIIASRRHEAQTDADRQRRITESFSKATEQLASDKIEVRLGGIYTMERIARETGGGDYDAREKGLAQNFKEIGEQLRSSYELGYHSSNPVGDDSFHKILIRLKGGSSTGLTVRSKTGYYSRLTGN